MSQQANSTPPEPTLAQLRLFHLIKSAFLCLSTPPLWSPLRTKSAFSALRFSVSPLLHSSAFPPSP
ncbi:hypothetical protein PAXRUDRAFT_22057 [Paxillus rubicundulus Ve08.2h10]|uniref:Uncharacterized protein n=1 Tax=Paxillus rubicundulus Ve08.2h10 TaxID=930991 RepID=A0A0D0BL49_9AGAM|nr:hypothetical protein PAXRUDRAFT_22057 [Paxillus rubicundulus Ve08.2h10]